MKLFQLSIQALVLRFYLLMAVVIVSLFSGIPMLAFLALPIFMSALLGASFSFRNVNKSSVSNSKIVRHTPGMTSNSTLQAA